ncbi:molybdenum cofactor guanylyltransferase [Salinimicrobium sediminilitoris]|uniref:molybdenum cofactor guanylyltransferase n=1 Tax=Salinimicrobium sediminilitoris TaxID=2876715 RepID=UPI001E3487BC|nr:molybdenum cofactor guanylyltransferase [Salinimicrobium sediminilitoris]MCC8358356.1 molybdenum cofactor guanylyltransferase [Salinimicrobium sediminilitoris]
MSPAPKIEAFVLAGGKSSRMGKDKGLVNLNNQPMVSYVFQALQEAELPVKIIANSRDYEKFGFPVCKDVVKERGPMGGLLTAFNNTDAEVVLLISCDMPFVNAEAINLLLKAVDEDYITAALVKDRINPLFAAYPLHLKGSVEDAIASEELKMTDFILKNPHTLVPSVAQKMPWCFRNINNEQELKEAEEKWSHLL